MARKKKDKSVEEKNKEIYDNLLEFLIQGNRKSLNAKNKKLLKDFENEVETYPKRIYFLYQIQDSYLEWRGWNGFEARGVLELFSREF